MKLTPIRVRGKRRQPKRSNKTSAQSEKMPDMADQPEPKRIKKHHTKASNGIGGMLSKDVPRLLQLPQEVLERVFIASKNLSLPLVNRELRRRLSTDSIKYQLVGAAFGPTWDAWYGIDNYELHSYVGWGLDVDRIEGEPAFQVSPLFTRPPTEYCTYQSFTIITDTPCQSVILACSWAKLDMLLTAYDIWARQHAGTRAYFTIPRLCEERLSKAPETGSLYEQAYSAVESESSDRPRSSNMNMRQKLAFDLNNFQRLAGDLQTAASSSLHESMWHAQSLLGSHLDIHPGTAICNDLLSGPFESEEDGSIAMGEDKARRLFWLVRGGARLQEEQTWEVTRDGFRAILQLVTGSTSDGISEADAEKRLSLAMQLFLLFNVLRVFHTQWPRCAFPPPPSPFQISVLICARWMQLSLDPLAGEVRIGRPRWAGRSCLLPPTILSIFHS